jgi:gliding motility-associated-like protein
MKRIILLFSFLVFTLNFFGQKNETKSFTIGSTEYKELKLSGELESLRLNGKLNLIQPSSTFQKKKLQVSKKVSYTKKAGSTCYDYMPPAVPPQPPLVDDQSIQVNLPFDFFFYGTTYNSLWINDNGTVSFDQGHGAFTAQGFPLPIATAGAQEIIAPFWADFHQAGMASGPIYFEVLPTALIVHWEDVGYFNSHDDKLNTMMLVLTDGFDPILQPGSNVGFFYEDMQWTTGDASSGIAGFGGDAATVGANKGDGVNYIQLVRFDGPGTAYDGPFTTNDSVSWLDNKTFMFNVGNSNNLPPIVAGIEICDTLRLCVGDTLPINASFLAPEANQITWVKIDSIQAPGFNSNSILSGLTSTAQVDAIFVGDISNIGINVINFMAYDNGTPSDTIQFNYIIVVDSMPFLPIITGDTSFCEGNSVILDAGSGFDSYLWSNDSITESITVTQGIYSVQAFIGGCSFTTEEFIVEEYLAPPLQITGDTLYCPEDSSLLNATPGFDSYVWNTPTNNTLDSLYVFEGSYFVTVIDANNCQWNSNTIDVVDFTNTVNITGDTTYCLGETTTIFAQPEHDFYIWNSNPADSLDSLVVTEGVYFLTAFSNGCEATDSITVSLINVPIPIIVGDTSYCGSTGSTDLWANGVTVGYDSYSWSSSPTDTNAVATNIQQGTYTVDVMLNGCSATTVTFTVVQHPRPVVLLENLHYCSNDANGVTVNTIDNYVTYEWDNGDATASTFASVGQIWVEIEDSNGCPGIGIGLVTSSAPMISFSTPNEFCSGETIDITANSEFWTYYWDSGENTQTLQNAGAGPHTLTVTDSEGCQDDSTIVLTPKPSPIANFSISPLDYQEPDLPVIFTNQSSGNIVTYNWNFDNTNEGDASPTFSNSDGSNSTEYSLQGTYSIQLIVDGANGCSDTVIQEYLIVDKIVASTVITPNGDLKNDNLVFANLWYYPNNKLTVYTRWGNTIFEQEKYQNDWDGGGNAVGTYYFILEVEGLEPMKGSFTILE